MKKRILAGALLTACLMGMILYTYRHVEKGYTGENLAETTWEVIDTTDEDEDMHGMLSGNTNEEYIDGLDVNNGIDNGNLNENVNNNTDDSTNENISDGINNNIHDISVIKVDLFGYQTNDMKKAYFNRGNVGDVFEVVNVKTKETVLTGKIDSKKTADFSQLTECGTYYIEVPYVHACFLTDRSIASNILFNECTQRR